jgi:hypothetical protein
LVYEKEGSRMGQFVSPVVSSSQPDCRRRVRRREQRKKRKERVLGQAGPGKEKGGGVGPCGPSGGRRGEPARGEVFSFFFF